jgi:hypothetical protein
MGGFAVCWDLGCVYRESSSSQCVDGSTGCNIPTKRERWWCMCHVVKGGCNVLGFGGLDESRGSMGLILPTQRGQGCCIPD